MSDCWPPNKFLLRGVGAFGPERRVANTMASYAAGRDRVLEAVLDDIDKQALSSGGAKATPGGA